MKIIIPMAGMGKRLRPHTLTTPKPLIKLAGKPIVEHLIDEIASTVKGQIDEIAFIIGHFGAEVEEELISCAAKKNSKGTIYYQEEALGTAHAILCAANSLKGPIIVAFADTIFFAEFAIEEQQEALVWTRRVQNPQAFGVVLTDADGRITAFREKPKEFVSDKAIIGIYYFKDGEGLKAELQYLIDNNICKSGEYQLTDALENMKNKGMRLCDAEVTEWLDCGNKAATVDTNIRVLEYHKINYIDPTAKLKDSTIIQPCYIGKGVSIEHSIVGPCVSIEDNSCICSSVVSNSIIQQSCKIEKAIIDNSMIGNFAEVKGTEKTLDLGDFSRI